MYGMHPRGPFGRGRQLCSAALLLLLLALFGAMLFGGEGCFALGAYCVEYVYVMGMIVLLLGVIALVLRRPGLNAD